MALNMDLVGIKTDPEPFTYDRDRIILYALGVGAGVEEELDFIYEKNLKVFPTFAVIPIRVVRGNAFLRQLNVNMTTLLHGEQKTVMHKEIPPEGTIYLSESLDSILDKSDKGAYIKILDEARDETGELIYENTALLVDRSGGNFGGDRGPKKEIFSPPDGKDPDFRVEYKTSVDQAALYRLSGDKILLHIDPEFAKMGGYDRPFLQGLCTYGIACRAILHGVCGSEPSRLKSFSVRFMNVVFPGDTLITEGWKLDNKTYIIQVKNQGGKIVLGNVFAKVS